MLDQQIPINKTQVFGKKGDVSQCQLCNQNLTMSQAHVPPKACIENDKRNRIASKYFFGESEFSLQNGVHFYTICGPCNNFIGSEYDKYLAEFSNEVRKKIHLFRRIPWQFEFKANRIARAVIAGYLTASRGCLDNSWIEIQKYVQQKNPLLPAGIKIGFWLHPYNSVVVKPDFIIIRPRNEVKRILGLIKYYPLSWVIYDQEDDKPDFCAEYGIHCFSDYMDNAIDKISKIVINPSFEKTEFWPHISDGCALMIGQNAHDNAVHAYPKENALY